MGQGRADVLLDHTRRTRTALLMSRTNRDQSRSRKQNKRLYEYGGLLRKP